MCRFPDAWYGSDAYLGISTASSACANAWARTRIRRGRSHEGLSSHATARVQRTLPSVHIQRGTPPPPTRLTPSPGGRSSGWKQRSRVHAPTNREPGARVSFGLAGGRGGAARALFVLHGHDATGTALPAFAQAGVVPIAWVHAYTHHAKVRTREQNGGAIPTYVRPVPWRVCCFSFLFCAV